MNFNTFLIAKYSQLQPNERFYILFLILHIYLILNIKFLKRFLLIYQENVFKFVEVVIKGEEKNIFYP